MDEEKQKDGLIKKAGDALKKGAKDQAKKSMQKVFKKVIMAIAPILLKFVAVVLIAAIVVTAISDFLDKLKGRTSKEANAFSVYYAGTSSEEDEESSLNRIIIDTKNVTDDGAYILTFEFKDGKGNLFTEEQALTNIKVELARQNADIDLNQFSNSELKIIGTLMYNGLKVEKYNEEQLKALAIFVKADIAANNFDLRSADKIGQTVKLEDMTDNDYVYGTLQMHRTKASEGYDSEQKLEFIPYGDENTPGTFCYMDRNSDTNIINKFSIDDEGKAVFARWSTVNTTHVYKDANGNKLSQNQIQQNIPEENIFENQNKTFITTTSFNYRQYLARYVENYGFLSDLLVVTDNVDFCLDLAQLAFNGKIVINIKEELSITDSTKITTYTQTKLLYDYVDYTISGQKAIINTSWSKVTSGSGSPSSSTTLKDIYGWSSTLTPESVVGGPSGGTTTYKWINENNGTVYKLDFTSTLSYSGWILYSLKVDTTYEDLPDLKRQNELIKLDHINEEYEEYTIDEDITKQEVFVYTIETTSHSESNSCSYEISELDGWYLKYHKQYEEPTTQTTGTSDARSDKGQYPKDATEVLTTTDDKEAKKYKEVKDYIDSKEKEYKDNNSATTVTSTVSKLVIKEKVKTDEEETYTSSTTKYKFGEEIADTTEVQIKNVEFINSQPTFTKGSGEEIGFLYVYDKYINSEVDLFLENDSETKLFELLEEASSTHQYSNIIKYLLYIYDGIDRGVTDLNIKIIDIQEMNKVKGSSTENFIKAWENGGLWAYETGQSTVFPTGYLSEDELNYIVYEDGSAGHNNISYGMATYISSKSNVQVNHPVYGPGYYNSWKNLLEPEGILVEELYEGAYVDKAIADAVFYQYLKDSAIDYVNNYLETNLPEYKFTKAQKDALVSVKWQRGNLVGFADAYKESLNSDGTLDPEKIKNNAKVSDGNGGYVRVFNYTSTVGDRKYANWLLFTEGTYIDRSGNVMSFGDIVSKAKEIHDYMSDPDHLYYYCLFGPEKSRSEHENAGLSCGLTHSWEDSKDPSKSGYRLTCCATYVSWVLVELGEVDTHYHYVSGVESELIEHGWTPILNYDELEAGDIVIMDTDGGNNGERAHVQIYAGDGCWYNAGGNTSIHAVEPYYSNVSAEFVIAYRK